MPVTLPPVTIRRARQLAHLQPVGIALELRHQVEARQRGVELAAQPAANFTFDLLVQAKSRSHSFNAW